MFQVFIITLLLYFNNCFSSAENYAHRMIIDLSHPINKAEVFNCKETRQNCVVFIRDSAGQQFVIKQTKENTPLAQLDSINELFATCIAESLHIPVNHVDLIPLGFDMPSNLTKQKIATLHTWVPGRPACEYDCYRGLTIRQGYRKRLYVEQIGLNRDIIFNMSVHQDLPRIVALDAFLGNYDRSRSNLLYDDKSGRFYIIDMERALSVNLCFSGCYHIKKMIDNNGSDFCPQEIEALRSFGNTLNTLVNKYPPDKQCDILDYFLSEAGFCLNGPLYHVDAVVRIEWYKKLIHEMYADAIELIQLVDRLVHILSSTPK